MMKARQHRIGLLGGIILSLFTFYLSTQLYATEPIDDVYYWSALEQPAVSTPEQTSQQPAESAKPKEESVTVKTEPQPTTNVEYVNVQDTTVTIKIKD